MSFEKYDNVHLYPGCKASEILNLFNTCDYYLDINYENEIVDATKEAFLHNLLILDLIKRFIIVSMYCQILSLMRTIIRT